MRINTLLLCTLLLSILLSCTNNNKELTSNVEVNTIEDSQYLLKNQMNDSLYQAIEKRRVRIKDRMIKTENEAIELGKTIFSKEFSNDFHLETRRYLAHYVKGFWVVKALQPSGNTGGTLVTVIDSENSDILYTLVWK